MALAAQGHLAAALSRLHEVPLEQFSDAHRATVQAMLKRFGAAPLRDEAGASSTDGWGYTADDAALDPWPMAVLRAYRVYWHSVLLGLATGGDGEARLQRDLARLAGLTDQPAKGFDGIEAALSERFQSQGLFTLFGRTAPLREFMLWREQEPVRHQAQLPQARVEVDVVCLDRFVSLGWLGFATAETLHTGGWAADGRLFCVAPAYRGKPEAFRVSFLTHEAQHLVDLREQPLLDQATLEYRAKLAELSVAQASLVALLAKFDANQSISRDSPHAFANACVMRDLRQMLLQQGHPVPATTENWQGVPADAVRKIATELLGLGRGSLTLE